MREFRYHSLISYSNTVTVVAHLQDVAIEHSRDLNEEVTSSTTAHREFQKLISTFYTSDERVVVSGSSWDYAGCWELGFISRNTRSTFYHRYLARFS